MRSKKIINVIVKSIIFLFYYIMEDLKIKTIDSLDRLEKIEEIKHREKEWVVCCSKSDKDGIKYITQIIICSIVLIFSFTKLSISDDNREIYFSLISFILGVILPNPQLKTKNNI